MIDPYEFVIIALAGWRLAYMLTNEDGPGDIFGWLRRKVGPSTWGDAIKPGSLDKLFSCVYCMTFWTTVVGGAAWGGGEIIRAVITFIALWGAATALDMVARKDG